MTMASNKISKHQRGVLVKAFRLLRAGCLEGERLSVQAEKDPAALKKLVDHVIEMRKLSAEIEQGLINYAGASSLLEQINQKRGKPTLRVLKGGG